MTTEEGRRRWDYAVELAGKLMDDSEGSLLGPGDTPSSSRDTFMAARAIYRSDIPTGGLPATVKQGHPLAQEAQTGTPGGDTTGLDTAQGGTVEPDQAAPQVDTPPGPTPPEDGSQPAPDAAQ